MDSLPLRQFKKYDSIVGFEADPSATGTSEGGRLRRSLDECRDGGEGIPPSPPVLNLYCLELYSVYNT